MSSTEPIDGEYVLYDEEPSPIYQNEGILQNVGEYLVAPLGQENVPTNNDNPATPRPPQVRQQSSQVDENNYSLATPESCPTARHGVASSPEKNKVADKGCSRSKKVKLSWSIAIIIVTIGGLAAVSVVMTSYKGKLSLIHFI